MNKLFVIFMLWGSVVQAQTNFYFDATGTSDVTPVSSDWTTQTGALNNRMLPQGFKAATTVGSTTLAVDNSTATATSLFYRGTSPALRAQTISGTVTGYFRMSIANATGATTQSRVKITVVNPAGVVQATLLAITSGAGTHTTTLTSYQVVNAATLTSYSCANGDRLVCEIGIGRSAGTTARNGTVSFGSSSATNLSAAGVTTADNPVMTFSGNITFLNGVPF